MVSYAPIKSVGKRFKINDQDRHGHGARSKENFQRRYSTLLDDTWVSEGVCLFCGVLLVIALCLVLEAYDGRPAPYFGSAFGSALTLNTVVAIVATDAQAFLIFPVAECVSQLKWTWFFRDYRSLHDISTFDKASRGIWGGLQLAWETRLMTLAPIGAVLMIFAFAIQPLSQQLISLSSQRIANPHLNASIPILQSLDCSSEGLQTEIIDTGMGSNDVTYNIIPSVIKGAIQSGLYSANESVTNIDASCKTANCTFEPYLSLAVCSSLANVTSHLRLHEAPGDGTGTTSDIRYYISTNQYIDQTLGGYFNVTSATPSASSTLDSRSVGSPLIFSDSIAFRNLTSPILDAFLLVKTGIEDGQFAAIEFVFEWCVQNFTTIVADGSTTTVRHNAFRTMMSSGNSDPSIKPFSGESPVYRVDASTHYSLQRYLRALLNGWVVQGGDNLWRTTSAPAQILFEPFNIFQGADPSEETSAHQAAEGIASLQVILDNISISMTNQIRRYGCASTLPTSPAAQIEGIEWITVTVVAVRWGWITAHLIFTVLSISFFVFTVLEQRRVGRRIGVWKSSTLSVLHALDPELQRELNGISEVSRLTVQDKTQSVRLVYTGGAGWRLLARGRSELDLDGIPLK